MDKNTLFQLGTLLIGLGSFLIAVLGLIVNIIQLSKK